MSATYPSELINSSNWVPMWNGSQEIRGTSRQYFKGFTTVTVPGLWETQVVITFINAPAKPNWRLGGYLRPKSSIFVTNAFIVEAESLFCPVNRYRSHFLPGIPGGYRFEFSIPNYIERVDIEMYRYTKKLETLEERRAEDRYLTVRDHLRSMQFELESELANMNFTP